MHCISLLFLIKKAGIYAITCVCSLIIIIIIIIVNKEKNVYKNMGVYAPRLCTYRRTNIYIILISVSCIMLVYYFLPCIFNNRYLLF